MQINSLKQKFIILTVLLIVIFIGFNLIKKTKTNPSPIPSLTIQQNESPKIISTKPDPLDETIISTTEVVEITFNRSLENVGEFKVRIEPKIDFKIELSSDRKTARIISAKPYQLGTTYTLFIGTETKFDGVGRWGEEKIYHFKTIKYRGV